MNLDERRTAHLLFDAELASGTLVAADLDTPDVREAVARKRVPSRPARALQRRLLKHGRLSWREHVAEPAMAARRALLGEAAAGPPRALVRIAGAPVHPRVGVAPAALERGDYAALAERHDVVCAGPDVVSAMGFHPSPQWRGDAVWLPAYPPLAGTAAEVLAALEELERDGISLWVPAVVLDVEESALSRLAAGTGSVAREWDRFLAAIDRARSAVPT
jgi:hypothetical protein